MNLRMLQTNLQMLKIDICLCTSVYIVCFWKLLAYSINHTSWNHSSVAHTQEAVCPVGKLAVSCNLINTLLCLCNNILSPLPIAYWYSNFISSNRMHGDQQVYNISLSKHTILNTFELDTSTQPSSTFNNSQQLAHSIARGMVTHFMQEHHDVLPRRPVKLAWLTLSSLLLATPQAVWFKVIRYNNIAVLCYATLCHSLILNTSDF